MTKRGLFIAIAVFLISFSNNIKAYAGDSVPCCMLPIVPIGIYGNYNFLVEGSDNNYMPSNSWGFKTGVIDSGRKAGGAGLTFSDIRFEKENDNAPNLSIKSLNAYIFTSMEHIYDVFYPYVTFGLGYYSVKKGDDTHGSGGFDLGVGGLIYLIRENGNQYHLALDFSYNYNHVFSGEDYFELRVGLTIENNRALSDVKCLYGSP